MSNNPAGQKIICQHCKKKFIPDPRNAHHQKYCSKPECRYASKRNSYQKWRAKNPDWFRGHDNVLRVQVWRREKGRSRGRMIFKLVIELMIFRKKGRKDRIKVLKKDGKGMVLQDFCQLRNAVNNGVILRLVKVLQVFIAQIKPKTYSAPQKDKKVRNERGKRCLKLKTRRRACLRRQDERGATD